MSPIPTQADVAVIGSGATGLAAAVTLAEGGAKVVVFEKQRSLGGTSNFLQGVFAAESDMQRERYVDYTCDAAFKGTMDYSHWRANPRLVRAIIDESGPTISWLQSRGVVFTEVTINMPDAPLTYHVIKGKGEAMVKALVDQAKSKGVEFFPGIPVMALLKEGGRISGVVAEADGEEMEVAIKAVVVATGGFANNKEWIKKYTGFDLGANLFPVGNTGKTGDGLRMAWEVGAAEEGVETIELFRVAPLGAEFAMGCELEQAGAQPDLWVTARGERFCDETISFWDTPVGNAQARLKHDGYTFSVFDDSIIERLQDRGLERGVGMDYPPGYKLTSLRKEIQAAVDNGSTEVFVAESIEDLAFQTGMDPAVLRATIEDYNGYCAKGHDELFVKDRRYLHPVVGPRFYAVRGRTVFLGTMGGVKVNARLEVLDKKDAVIPGLYAGGFDAGGMYGDSYPIKGSSGLASAFALNSGRIAGKSALEYLER
ncbi:MAG: FAD-dependent oxidoreductase [Actinobacteria bacterium]|jgi:fumarate reductase flavoprotein subunit|nr:FAD-dependent oxidoreductase [Actinomycetota bacterium]